MNKFIILILFLIMPNIQYGNDLSEKDKVVGFWTTSYPVSDNMNGYIFIYDGKLYYSDNSDYNLKNQYDGSVGSWKILDNKIMIKIEYDLLWKSKWILNRIRGLEPGDNNELIVIKHSNSEWISIGDLRLYSEAKSFIDDKKSSSRPEMIPMKPIMNKEIMQSERFYCRVCIFNNKNYVNNCRYPQNIIKAYDKILSKYGFKR